MNPIMISGVEYFGLVDVAEELEVSRQTLWRWRRNGSIPAGFRFRDRRVFFTAAEVEKIMRFANRIEPIDQPNPNQMNLFA